MREPCRTLRIVAAAVAMTISLAAGAQTAARKDPPPDLQGPLSDFRSSVQRDLDRRHPEAEPRAVPTGGWVPIVWDGPDDAATRRFVETLKKREALLFFPTPLTMHRWSDIAGRDLHRMLALRQNLIILGRPEDNGLVGHALEATPLRIGRGHIKVGGRRVDGDDLLLIAIVPNPIDPSHYATVITATSPEALLTAGDVPYGDTDYIIFRGQRVLERGFFEWKDGAPARDQIARRQSFSQHLTWTSLSSTHIRLHYDPAAMRAAEMELLGRRLDAEVEETAAFFGIDTSGIPSLDLSLYISIDEKVSQTADMRPAHLDSVDLSLHAVHGSGFSALSPQLLARALLARASSLWGARQGRELPGLAFVLSLACRDTFQGIPLAEWAARSRRDVALLPMDRLFYREPAEMESGDLDPLDAAAFLRDLIGHAGIGKLSLFYRTTRRSGLGGRFKEIFGLSLAEAEQRWIETLPREAVARSKRIRARIAGTDGAPSAPAPDLASALAAFEERDDAAAEKLLVEAPPGATSRTLLARVCFRTGRFERAAALASEALAFDDASAQDRAWAHLTRGRAHAASGRLVAAISDLRNPEVMEGPEQVRILADYWLEKMGQPLNQHAAHHVLIQQASTELLNSHWEDAAEKMNRVLASDPANAEAHALLGQVYFAEAQYWSNFVLEFKRQFGGDTDPDVSPGLPVKGREEIRIASSIPPAQPELWLSESGEEVLIGEKNPGPLMTRFLEAKALILKGELEAAARDLTEVLKLNPPNRNLAGYCHLYLGRIALRQDDPEAARAHFKAILRLKPRRQITATAREEMKKIEAAPATPDSRR